MAQSAAMAMVRAKSDRTKDGHRVWKGAINKRGSPKMRVGTGRSVLSARKVVYEMINGPVPDRHRVMPSCHCHGCVEPSHLVAVPMAGLFVWLAQRGALDTIKNEAARLKAANRRRTAPFAESDSDRPLVSAASIFSFGAALGRQQRAEVVR
jgi:hypothetical protein